MKRYLSIFLLIVIFINIKILAQTEEDELSTKGWSNGKMWEKLDAQAKITLLIGIESGIALFNQELTTELVNEKDIDLSEQLYKHLTISGFKFSDIKQQIDSFYKDRSNIRIPIAYAYFYVIKKISGLFDSELKEYVASLRRMWNN